MPKREKPKRKQTTTDGNWPVRFDLCESAVRFEDEYRLKYDPPLVDAGVKYMEARVKEEGQSETLDILVNQGCPRRELLYLLAMCENRGLSKTEMMVGHNSVALRLALKKITKCADMVSDLICGGEFGRLLELPEESTLFRFLNLPTELQEFATLVDHAVKYIAGRNDFYLHIAKARLANAVLKHTGKHHHKHVANLLSVNVGDGYAEAEHRVWHSTYLDRIERFQSDPEDSPAVRAKKNLLECRAAILLRLDVRHPGDKYLRVRGASVLCENDPFA